MIKCFYVINLQRREDRWNECYQQINKSNLKNQKIIRWNAFDGYDFENELKRFNIPNSAMVRFIRQSKIKVSKGEFGVLMSHYLLLKQIAEDNNILDDDYIGIFEDDFHYGNNFNNNLSELLKVNLKELDIEFLYLGGRFIPSYVPNNLNSDMFEKTKHPRIYLRKNRYSGGKNWDRTIHSYIVKKSICKKLADLISVKFVSTTEYINNKLCFVPIDHLLAWRYNDIKMFDYLPHLFYSPMNYKSDIQGQKHNIIV
jgi:GR25 family glycosyltransferase involved in LPS biosynthesis